MPITYYQNPDDSLAFIEVDGGVSVTGGSVHEDAVELTQEQYDAAVAARAAQHESDVADLIASNDAVLPEHVKLYRYLHDYAHDKLVPPHEVDFITGIDGRLHPTNAVIVDGEIRQVDYYAEATPPNASGIVTYSDLVIRETFVYTRDAIGFARARVHTITWYTEDDEPHPDTKVRVKYYENDESLREGQRRRANITDTLAMTISGWLLATQTGTSQERIQMGRDFMRHHKIDFDSFIDASDSTILYSVQDDVEPAHAWLDDDISTGVTVRAYIIDALNIWNLVL